MSIMDGDKGLVVHCHAGCSQDDVINALKIRQLWPSSKIEPPQALPPPVKINLGNASSGKGQIVATYDYTDEDGNLLYQAVRYEPKDFRQRKPMPDGSWSWSIKDVRRVLYRLPEVMQAVADGRTILICEGEKDVENARARGWVATCNAMGADNGNGNKWFLEFADCLTGADVIVVPDNDEAGTRHANYVITTLTGKVKSLRVASPKWGKDLSDWLEAQPDITLDVIRAESVDAVQQELPAQQPEKSFEFIDVADLVSNIQPISWVVRDYLERDSIALVYGSSGSGKSFLTVDIACAIATGSPWMGNKVHSGTVFYIAGEGHNGLARRFRAWEIARDTKIPAGALYKSAGAMQVLSEESALSVSEQIASLCESTGQAPSLVVIDTLARNFGAGDENSTADMSRFITHVDAYIRQRFGCCVMLVHHSGHNAERARGSSALKAAVDAEYEVSRDETGIVRLRTTKMKDAELPAELMLRLKTVDIDDLVDEDGQQVTGAVLDQAQDLINAKVGERTDGTLVTAKDAMLVLDRGWLSGRELGEALNVSRRRAEQIITTLERYGYVVIEEKRNGVKANGALTEDGKAALSRVGHTLTGMDKPIWKRGDD